MAHFSNFLLLLLATTCILFTAESLDLWYYGCNENAIINSTKLSSKIDALLPRLVSKTLQKGYTTAAAGSSRAQVIYGLAQCRGDLSRADCADCIQTAAKQIRNFCPNQTDARVIYDYCFLRYSTQRFAGTLDFSPGMIVYDPREVSDPDSFNKKLGSLTYEVTSEAVKPRNKGLGRGKSEESDFGKIYELAECTRDLSPLSCSQCLASTIRHFDGYCKNKKECRVIHSSCIMRYALYPVYFPLEP